MVMMAHKDNGFKSAESLEVEEMIKNGWVLCDDVMKFKREVMGIGKVEVVIEQVIEIEPESATIEEEVAVVEVITERKRAGRPRKADQEFAPES